MTGSEERMSRKRRIMSRIRKTCIMLSLRAETRV